MLTHRGKAVGVILPLESTQAHIAQPGDEDESTAWTAFVRAGRRLAPRFRPGRSGVRLLSASRR